jgi:hypothetical protein
MQLINRPKQRDWQTRIPITAEFADARENTHLKIQVEYTLGGTNYFSSTTNARGYRVSFRRVQCKDDHMESFILFGDDPMDSGYIMLEPAPRYNAKRLQYWAEKVEDVLNNLASAILGRHKAEAIAIVEGLGARSGKPLAPPPAVVKKLLTEGLKKILLTAGMDNQVAICKFFNPAGGGTWIISGMDSDGDTLWCLADLSLDCCEQGTVSLKELQETKLPMGLHIERDLYFRPAGRTLADFQQIYDMKHTLAGVS